jgi:hypothetical protein
MRPRDDAVKGRTMTTREDWIEEVVRCAIKAHDSAGMAMVSDDESIGDRDPLGRLVTIVEIGVMHGWVTAEGELVPPPPPDAGAFESDLAAVKAGRAGWSTAEQRVMRVAPRIVAEVRRLTARIDLVGGFHDAIAAAMLDKERRFEVTRTELAEARKALADLREKARAVDAALAEIHDAGGAIDVRCGLIVKLNIATHALRDEAAKT